MSHRASVLLVVGLMLVLGLPSALSFSPVELKVFGMPFLDFMDQFGGTNVVIISGAVGAGLFCWFVSPEKISTSLGSNHWWWRMRILTVGRALPLIVFAIFFWRFLSP